MHSRWTRPLFVRGSAFHGALQVVNEGVVRPMTGLLPSNPCSPAGSSGSGEIYARRLPRRGRRGIGRVQCTRRGAAEAGVSRIPLRKEKQMARFNYERANRQLNMRRWGTSSIKRFSYGHRRKRSKPHKTLISVTSISVTKPKMSNPKVVRWNTKDMWRMARGLPVTPHRAKGTLR